MLSYPMRGINTSILKSLNSFDKYVKKTPVENYRSFLGEMVPLKTK